MLSLLQFLLISLHGPPKSLSGHAMARVSTTSSANCSVPWFCCSTMQHLRILKAIHIMFKNGVHVHWMSNKKYVRLIRWRDFWYSNYLHRFVSVSGHLSIEHDINLVCPLYPSSNHVCNFGYDRDYHPLCIRAPIINITRQSSMHASSIGISVGKNCNLLRLEESILELVCTRLGCRVQVA